MKIDLSKYKVIGKPEGNFIATPKSSPNDIHFFWETTDRVEFQELDTPASQIEDPIIRILSITYRGCKIQFRATQSLKKGTKKRNLIATAFLSKTDLKHILTQMGGY